MSQRNHALRIWRLCQECALTVANKRPAAGYADRVARLLFGTAAQESGLRWERQRTPRFEGNVGGFGKWQVEPGSVEASRVLLRAQPKLLVNATAWLFADPKASVTWVDSLPPEMILWAMRLDDNDKIGVMFARLHYLRVKAPVPEGLSAQAAYWKRWYNTAAGSGTVDQYLANWNVHCREVAGD